MKVVKEIQWDMGHRVTNHRSHCRNLHGHRYKVEICVEGDLINREGVSDEGMVVDFGDIKKIAIRYVHDKLDHGFMVWDKDKVLLRFFKDNPALKHIVVPFVPTSENIAVWIFEQLDKRLHDRNKTGLRLYSVKLWETPTSVAICTRQDFEKIKNKKK